MSNENSWTIGSTFTNLQYLSNTKQMLLSF